MKVRWAGKPPPNVENTAETEIDYTEGLWDELTGGSWMFADGNPACILYAIRAGASGLPTDDLVHYVHIGGLGHLVHETELVDEGVTA